jgi:hypothetical protein
MNIFTITGDRIKIAGDNPEVGLYFEQTDGPAKIKVTDIAENTANKLIGMCPGGPAGKYKVVVKTQYAGSGSILLKNVRAIESGFTLE